MLFFTASSMYNLTQLSIDDTSSVSIDKYSKTLSSIRLRKQIMNFLLLLELNYCGRSSEVNKYEITEATSASFLKLQTGRNNNLFFEAIKPEIIRDYETISYIIYASSFPSNIKLVMAKIDGRPLISLSSGTSLYKGKQKINKIALNEMTRKLIVKSRSLKTTGVFLISLKGIRRYRKILLTRLKDVYPVRSIKINNLTPHNGCRAKKVRRK